MWLRIVAISSGVPAAESRDCRRRPHSGTAARRPFARSAAPTPRWAPPARRQALVRPTTPGPRRSALPRRTQRHAAANGKPAQRVPQRVGLCVEGFGVQEMIDVANQRIDALVAARRVRVHRGQAQHVEIGPEPCRWLDPRRAPRCAARRPTACWRSARRQRRAPPVSGVERSNGRHRQSADRARRPMSRCRSERRRARRESVRATRRPASSAGGRCGSRSARRSASSSCLAMPKSSSRTVPIRLHQDVRRLEIAMDDAVPVRVGNGVAHAAKQPQTIFERRAGAGRRSRPAASPSTYSMTNHGVPSSRSSRVVQAGDRGVIELCERALFGGEAFAASRREPGVSQELDGDLVPRSSRSAR